MKVVVAGRVSISPGGVDVLDGCVPVVDCPEVPAAVVPLDEDVVVVWAPAAEATASISAAAITTRFNMRTSASKTD
jgi:hypothetical protein